MRIWRYLIQSSNLKPPLPTLPPLPGGMGGERSLLWGMGRCPLSGGLNWNLSWGTENTISEKSWMIP